MNRFFLLNVLVFALVVTCAAQEKKLVWSDEFDVEGSLSPIKWNYELGFVRNGEQQFYTNRQENVRVENGCLVIEAIKENFDDTAKYTSSSITTKNIKTWVYGRFEVRAKIPTGTGAWPAIWMLGNNIDEKGWPLCGEIDILENVGYEPDVIHANIHTKAYNHALNTNKGNSLQIDKPYSDFHLYAMDWDKDKIDFYVDDQLYFTYINDHKGDVNTWPYNEPFYLIINLAIGGGWGGLNGIDEGIFPIKYYIDYVRVYE